MKKALIAVVLSMAAVGSAFAQGGVYLGVESGPVFFDDTLDELSDVYIYDHGADSASADQQLASLTFRPFVGYGLTDQIALEIGLTFFSRETTVSGYYGGYVNHYKDTYTESWRMVDYAVLWHPSGNAGFFARAGAHSTTYKIEVKGNGVGNDSASDSQSGLQLGLGYDWKMGPGAFRVSFTHYGNMPGYEDEALNLLKFGYLFQF